MCICVYVYVHMYICIYICIYVCVCIYVWRKKMSFLFILLPRLSNELLWGINKLKQWLWCTIWLSYIYIYIYIYLVATNLRWCYCSPLYPVSTYFVFWFVCLSWLYVPFCVTVLLFIVANQFQEFKNKTVKFNSEQTLCLDIGRC